MPEGDGQPPARAATGAGPVGLVEAVEDPAEVGVRDARAAVEHLDDRLLALPPGADLDALPAVADGVAHEVHHAAHGARSSWATSEGEPAFALGGPGSASIPASSGVGHLVERVRPGAELVPGLRLESSVEEPFSQ